MNLAAGVNAIRDFYDAWPYNSGISESGLQSIYSESDLLAIGGSYLSLGARGPGVMQNLAENTGMAEPSVSNILNALVTAGAQGPGFFSAVGSTAWGGVQSAAGATQGVFDQAGSIEKAAAEGISSILSSPKTVLALGAVIGLAVIGVVYYPEIKAAGRSVKGQYGSARDYAKQKYGKAREYATRAKRYLHEKTA